MEHLSLPTPVAPFGVGSLYYPCPAGAHPGYSNAQAPPYFCAPLFSEVQYISASVFLAFTFVLVVLMLESGYTQRQVKFRSQEDIDMTAAAIAGSSIAFFMYCIFV